MSLRFNLPFHTQFLELSIPPRIKRAFTVRLLLLAEPVSKILVIFFVPLRNIAVPFSFLKCHQKIKFVHPLSVFYCCPRIPDNTELFQTVLAWLFEISFFVYRPLVRQPRTKILTTLDVLPWNIAVPFSLGILLKELEVAFPIIL